MLADVKVYDTKLKVYATLNDHTLLSINKKESTIVSYLDNYIFTQILDDRFYKKLAFDVDVKHFEGGLKITLNGVALFTIDKVAKTLQSHINIDDQFVKPMPKQFLEIKSKNKHDFQSAQDIQLQHIGHNHYLVLNGKRIARFNEEHDDLATFDENMKLVHRQQLHPSLLK